MKHTVTILICCILTACNNLPYSQQAITPIRLIDNLQDITADINRPFIGFPTPNNYSICHYHSCSKIAFASLSDKQWQTIELLFQPIATNAAQEREYIKLAVALLERYTGEQTGTYRDLAENDISQGLNGQLDCIDEATNTTVYIRMLQNAGLLHWHQQTSRLSRSIFSGNTPHNTATIIDIETSQRFAVDSWFGDNGQPPAIVKLEQWQSGWRPPQNF